MTNLSFIHLPIMGCSVASQVHYDSHFVNKKGSPNNHFVRVPLTCSQIPDVPTRSPNYHLQSYVTVLNIYFCFGALFCIIFNKRIIHQIKLRTACCPDTIDLVTAESHSFKAQRNLWQFLLYYQLLRVHTHNQLAKDWANYAQPLSVTTIHSNDSITCNLLHSQLRINI